MAIIRDRSLVEDWNNVSIPMLVSCIKEHQASKSRYDELEAYYLGKHPILTRNNTAAQYGLPNNRLVANHAKYITDIAVGYMIGDPVKYEGNSIDEIKKVYDQIDIVSHDAEIAKDLSIFGEGRELYYMTSDDVPIPKATALDPRQIFLVVDDTVEYKSLFGVHYYAKRDIDNTIIGYYVNVYAENTITRYETKELNSQTFKLLQEPEVHYFGGVPVVEFWNNEERQGDFEQQISLIDAYNVLMSDRVNDKEQLVDALLAISGGATLGDSMSEATETAKKIKELKILELPLGADAKWLTKNLTESDVEVLRDAIREDIHQFAMVPNLTDENFASNASGVAMKYKLLGLEQLAKIKERYFIQGLRERLKLFANVLEVKGKAVDVSDVKITMTRNLPANDVEIANMISQLSDSVPNETLIGQLSFIDDPSEQNKLLNKQKDEELKRSQQAFSMPFGDVNDDEETK